VVVLPSEDERPSWAKFSAGQLANAYGGQELEYTVDDLLH